MAKRKARQPLTATEREQATERYKLWCEIQEQARHIYRTICEADRERFGYDHNERRDRCKHATH